MSLFSLSKTRENRGCTLCFLCVLRVKNLITEHKQLCPLQLHYLMFAECYSQRLNPAQEVHGVLLPSLFILDSEVVSLKKDSCQTVNTITPTRCRLTLSHRHQLTSVRAVTTSAGRSELEPNSPAMPPL